MTGLQLLSDVGTGTVVIQSSRTDPAFLGTAWTVQVSRGFILAALAAALSWPAAVFYGEPRLTLLISVAGLGLLISGLNSIRWPVSQRRLQMGRLTFMELTSGAARVATAISWAAIWPTVWALIGATLVGNVVRMLLSQTVLSGPKDRFRWDVDALRSFSRLGPWIILSSATFYLASQGEKLLLGKVATLAEFGVFSIALMLTTTGTAAPMKIISRVLFPALAESLRHDRERTIARYGRLSLLLTPTAAGLLAVMTLFGDWTVQLLYDARYAAAGWMIAPLAIRATIDLLRGLPSEVLKANGTLQYLAMANVAQIVAIGLAFIAGAAWGGLTTIVWGLAASAIPGHIVVLVGLQRELPELFRIALAAFLILAGVAVVLTLSGASTWI